jgi:hypothetical protein
MRTLRLASVVLASLALFALPSCSALGLDNIPVTDCSRQGATWADHDTFCTSLAMTNPVPDSCHDWHCSHTSHHCEILPTDMDHDGWPSMMCAGGATADCLDSDARLFPMNPEVCDGLDNDCDGAVDEDVIQTQAQTSTLTALMAPDQLALAARSDADEIMLVTHAATGFAAFTITTNASPTPLALTQMGTGTLPVWTTSEAIAALGSNTPYALVAPRMTGGTCGQFGLFPLGGARSGTLNAGEPSLFPSCPGAATVGFPAIAGAPTGEVVFSWFEADETVTRNCGAAPAQPVLISTGYVNSSSLGHDQISPDAPVTLGSSVDYVRPALLAIDATHFLVSYPLMDGTIPVHLVTTQTTAGATHITSSAVAYTEPATSAAMPQSVVLGLGPTDSTTSMTSIALAFHDGCALSNAITVRMLHFDGRTLHASGMPATGLGDGATRKDLQIVYQPRSEEWLLAWDAGDGLEAQRLHATGTAEGPPFALVMGAHTRPRPWVVQALRGTTSLFRTVGYDGGNLTQTTFGCTAM